jgi:hypothetical protein
MLCAYGHPDQETPSENSIIFTHNFYFCAKRITHHNSILQSLLATVRTTAGDLAQAVECSPSNREVRGSNRRQVIFFYFS